MFTQFELTDLRLLEMELRATGNQIQANVLSNQIASYENLLTMLDSQEKLLRKTAEPLFPGKMSRVADAMRKHGLAWCTFCSTVRSELNVRPFMIAAPAKAGVPARREIHYACGTCALDLSPGFEELECRVAEGTLSLHRKEGELVPHDTFDARSMWCRRDYEAILIRLIGP